MQLNIRIEHAYKRIQIPLVKGPDELSNRLVGHGGASLEAVAVGVERLVLFGHRDSRKTEGATPKKLSETPTATASRTTLKPHDTS